MAGLNSPDMLGASDVIAFVATTDSAKAKAFYRDVLGLRFIADDSFALVFDANGTMLRIQKVRESPRAPFTTLGWQVADIAATVGTLSKRGVVFERIPGIPQDAFGVWAAPGGDKVAWFKDPDGNILSVTQFRASR